MKERPIIFSGPMIRALRDGRKTQTRRVVKHPLLDAGFTDEFILSPGNNIVADCPYGKPGDRLWFWPLWESIHGEGSWDRNPWVWAVTFERVDGGSIKEAA